MKEKIWSIKCWYSKEIFLSLRCALHCEDNIVIEYLNEIENEFENTAACLSRAQMGPKNEKK